MGDDGNDPTEGGLGKDFIEAGPGGEYAEVPISKRRPAIGVADQSTDTFDAAAFRELGVRRSRLVVPWNQVLVDPAPLDRWPQPRDRRSRRLDPLTATPGSVGRCVKWP